MNLKKLPKVLLNLNFESSVSYDELKQYTSLNYDELEEVLFVNKNDDLKSYNLKKKFSIDYLQTPNKIKKAACRLALKLKEDNIIYSEIVVTPKLHTLDGLTFDDVLYNVILGLKEAEATNYKILIGTLKNESEDVIDEIIELYEKYKNDGVCGISFIGDSLAKRIPDLKEIFDLLYEKNIPYSFECNKYDTEEDIRHLVKRNVKRIVGGLNSMIDFSVMGEAILKRVLYVEAPKALIAKKELNDYLDDKLIKMNQAGGLIAISIDSLTIENINLTDELNHLIEVQMFNEKEILNMNRNALLYSFLDVLNKTRYSEVIVRYESKG